MGASDFLPSRDADLVNWSNNFSARITASPSSVGLVASQCTAYAALNTSFAAAYATAVNPSTRTRSTVALKSAARASLVASARDLSKIIQAFPAMTNALRLDLGLSPRGGAVSPINPPVDPPVLEVVSAVGRTLKVRLHGLGSDRRSKPRGVSGASLFSTDLPVPPTTLDGWKFEGSVTRTEAEVVIDPSVPAGAKVFLTAFWYNPRAQSGPACTPVEAYIAGGVSAVS